LPAIFATTGYRDCLRQLDSAYCVDPVD